MLRGGSDISCSSSIESIVIFHSETDIGIRRDRPKISWFVEGAEFVFRMVLRKAAVVFRVGSAFAARSEICDELLKLGHAALYFDAGQDLSRRRLNQDVYAIRQARSSLRSGSIRMWLLSQPRFMIKDEAVES